MSSTTSLPTLREGQSCLVAPAIPKPQTPTPRQRASQWAQETRERIGHCIETNNEVPYVDIMELKQELISAFIVALQQKSRGGWVYLHEVLALLEPYKKYFEAYEMKDELYHYLERIVYHVEQHKEKLFDLQLIESLNKVFPDEIAKLRQAGAFPARNYCMTPPTLPIKSPTVPASPKRSGQSPRTVFRLPDGTNPYNTHVPHDDRQIVISKPLTLRDLQSSIADVGAEFAIRESIWNNRPDVGNFARALQTEIPQEPKSKSSPPSRKSTPRSSVSSISPPKLEKKTPRIEEEPVMKLTGREAVEYFAKLHHVGKIQSIYFNRIKSRHYRPYDLLSVHKNKAEPEHFVFSTFGVLHVFPDQPAESQSLSEWQREAVLWTAVSAIPFFKNYLVRKMFYRWRCNKLNLDYQRQKEAIGKNLLQAVPMFGAALLQVCRLLKELITVEFLPFDVDKTYQLTDFENSANFKNIQAENILDRFFSYCKLVIDVTAEESFKKLRHCEEQVKKKTVFSKDSLHLQQLKAETREFNLQKAKSETGRLGNFVKLIDQLIVEHMFEICKTQVITFVDTVLNTNSEENRNGFFRANLIFIRQDALGLSPSKEKFISALTKTLKGIPTVLCAKAIAMDGSVTENEERENEDEVASPTKSVSEINRALNERRKSIVQAKLESRLHGDTETMGEEAGEQQETESQDGSEHSVGDDELLTMPEVQRQEIATKEEDDMGIATPSLVIQKGDRLVVQGEGFMGQYSPLSKASLVEKLEKDCNYQKALKLEMSIINDAIEEIDAYCNMNQWLCDIYTFCQKWTSESPKEYRGSPAFAIEQRLIELRQWTDRVRNFDKNFTTDNGLFYIDCTGIHDYLVPRLTEIVQELLTFVSNEAHMLANEFCDEMAIVLENLKKKDSTMAGFAVFAKNYSTYKKNGPQYQQRVAYIKSLFETAEEEKTDDEVQAVWEAYMLQLQDASEFVNTQTPLMTQKLEDKVQILEKEALELAELSTTGKFLDPSQNPTKILADMRKIKDRFFEVQSKMHEASKWRDAICGEPYDLDFLHDINVKMDVRQELWKYVEVSMHAIKDCKQMLFKKMNIKKMLEKIIEWQAAAGQLKSYLPPGDLVLSYWFTSLREFKNDLPMLHRLANDALKERHWKAIFVGMNEPYNADRNFTVADLLSYNLIEHSQLIDQVYQSAIAEYDLELKINQVSKFWEERVFKLAKHIPDSVISTKEQMDKAIPNEDEMPKKPSSPRRRTKLEKYRQERAAAMAGQPQGLKVADDDFFILIEVDELKYQLEDSRISIRAMMQSPFLGDMRTEVEYWDESLHQVEEITDLWFACQRKWLYLLKVFEKPELYKKYHGLSIKFEQVHTKFKDWMRVVSNDSKVLTVVNRKRGEKGYRLLQGDNLRTLFLQLIQQQEEILKFLNTMMENSRMEFPRLYFISNEELVELLGVSRNPKALLPFARKCFHGIQDLTFALPPGTGISSLNTMLDFALNVDKLEVTTMQGMLGEEVPLLVRINAQPLATKWLKSLENVMKNTIAVVLQACVQARMEEGHKQPIQLLEELAKFSQSQTPSEQDLREEIKHTYRHWLLRFPVQCVLVAEGILWERNVTKCLEKGQGEDLKLLRTNASAKLDQYIEILRESYNFNGKVPANTKKRLCLLLCSLINQTMQHRDIMDALISSNKFCDGNFEWLRIFRYHMDITSVLRAKTESVEQDTRVNAAVLSQESVAAPSTSVRKTARSTRRSSLVSKVRIEQPTVEETPRLTRTKTTVSNDYQFSLCQVTQLGNTFSYNYEYQGPTERLVTTPLTDRAMLSLTQGLKSFYCGTLIGPAGVGKSETVKELAKLFGQMMYTVNCNEDLTVSMMSQYMMGIVQSGCWVLFDDTNRLTKGLMSVSAQHLDYLRTALRTLELCSENQYKIRGQARFDKKMGLGDKIIRRNSLTTLHPMPNKNPAPMLERQKTVPHGFNEKGLVTYFEDTWVSEKDRRRRHSIEREIKIKESDLYKNNKPPPLFYEHVKLKGGRKSATPDYSKLINDMIYVHNMLGNIMFNGKLIQASANFGCFMTMSSDCLDSTEIPENFRQLMRPCAMIMPDYLLILEVTLCCRGYKENKFLAKKLNYLLKQLKLQLPRKSQYQFGLKDIKLMLNVAESKLKDERFLMELRGSGTPSTPGSSPTSSAREIDRKTLEEHSIVYALKTILLQAAENENDASILSSILRDLFPVSSKLQIDHEYELQLVKAVKDQLKEDNLTETKEIVSKIMQLHCALNLQCGVIMVGPAGSGKTTCSQTLARSMNRLNYQLFAPDHSKDELTTDRDLVYYAKHKLKGMENEPELQDDIFLSAIDPKAKTEMSKSGKKMQRMSLMLGRVSDAIHEMQASKVREYAEHPKVDMITLNPTAMSPQEFLGEFSNGLWKGGLLPKILHDSGFLSEAVKSYIVGFKDKKAKGQDLPSILLRWIVMDGVMHPTWTESLNTLFDQENKLSLANSSSISLADTTTLLYETAYLGHASPATVSRCTVINFNADTVHWSSLYESWTRNAQSKWIISARVMKVWNDIVSDVFGPTIKFLRSDCCSALMTDVGHMEMSANEIVPGIQEVETFLKILTALLDRMYLRDEFEKKQKNLGAEGLMPRETTPISPSASRQTTSRLTSSSQIEQIFPNYDDNMKGVFAFAYIWGFGGHIHERFKDKFSKFAHDALYRASHPIRIPIIGTVFDYCLDESTGIFMRWNERSQERMKVLPGGFTITPEVEKYVYLVDMMLTAHQPVLISGMPGVGKTSLLQTMVLSKHVHSNILMSPAKSSQIFQDAMMGHILELKHKASSVLQGPGGGVPNPVKTKQSHLFFIDDLNTAPANKEGGYQPPLELLRQILSQGGTYDRERKELQSMEEAQFLCATTLPSVAGSGLGKSCHVMSSRLTRRFVNFTLFTPTAEGLMNMFGRNIQNWLEEFPTYSIEHHFELSRAMTIGLLDLYQRIKERFRPTPAFAHYTFSLHDVSRVVHGILLMSPRSRTRKMLRRKKADGDSRASISSTRASRQTSWDSKSRSVNSSGNLIESGQTAPMMKVIGQLWCHECTRTFADRLVSEEDQTWYSKLLEDIVMKYFCMPRDDPKSEMAVISEETYSQTGHTTPTQLSSRPITPTESDEETEGELSKVEDTKESKDSKDTDDVTLTDRKSETSITASDTPDARLSIDTERITTIDTETAVSARTGRTETERVSESEYETEISEESEESSDGETTETETDMETPRDLLLSKKSELDEHGKPKDLPDATVYQHHPGRKSKDSSTKSTISSGDFTELPAITKPPLKSQDSGISSEGGGLKASTPSIKASQRVSHGSLKMKTVTFKAGLLADWEHEAYFGPLMNMDEIKGSFDSLTDFIFSKFYMTTHTETHGLQPEKGYVEASEEALSDALGTCLNVYNAGTSQKLELVFFTDAVRHAARLSRVLAIQGGHAVLLGMSYSTGRATLARLAAYIAHCKLFEPKPQTDHSKNLRIVHEHIKRACYHTGVLGRPTVLLIHEALGHECLQDVACIMAEGTSPGLYSEDELSTIVSQMMPGGVQTKRVDKIEQAFERFLKRIRQNLHVIVCLNYKGNSYSSEAQNLHAVLPRYPGLIKHAVSIDTYRPWQYEAYVKVADVWLRDQRARIPIPWHPTRMLDQIAMTAQAMAYVHMSSKMVVERQYCHQREPLRFFSPLTYMEFVHLFRVISAYIVKKEYDNIQKHEQALGKVNEAFGSISELKREVSDLMPQHQAAVAEIKALVEEVESQKEQYIGALDRCKDQEELIEGLQGPLEELRREAQTEFDKTGQTKPKQQGVLDYYTSTQYKVNPNYNMALTALNSLSRYALEEVKSFRAPPEPVEFVMNAVCLLFNEPQDWEHAKLLMIRENFMDALIFYDKDNIPDDIYNQLHKFTLHPKFQPDFIRSISLATASICTWVHAVYNYAHIHRNMQPRLRNLLEQEEKFTQAQAKLGQLRVEANRIKSALEKKITVHRAAVKRAKTIEKHMQSIEKKIARSVNLMEHMSMQHFLWKSELRKARHNCFTAPGDALITAACVLYHGPLSDRNRSELLHDWLDRAKQGNFLFSKPYGHDNFPLNTNLDGLLDGHKEKDSTSEISSSHGGEGSMQSESTTSGMPSMPAIKTFKYLPAIYDTSKYYKSELRRQGSMEYDTVPENDDSDDEDEQSPLMNRNGYLLQEILSDFDELSGWRLENLPTDLHSIQNALIMRVSCYNRKTCWPLLIDPDNQAEMWVKALQTSKNIFSETELRDGEDPFSDQDIPIAESYKDSELPPSRGTSLTMTETATEYTFRDETGATTATSYATEITTKSGFGRHSRNTFNTEELRPVTSVAASWETYSHITVEQSIENRPDHNLWIVEADDPNIDSRLITAVVNGITVLVTHLERKPLSPLFRSLLLKQFYVDKDGMRIIRVGGMEFHYHPDFSLYLSTSIPLFLRGDGLYDVPLHRMCIINMSLSDEAIINHLLIETMKVERKEFEGQKRSNENDIIMHRQRLVKEHDLIREKTLNLEGPLLEDQTMLKSLMECQKEVERNRMILEETRFMGDHLEEKFAHYMPMIMQSALMYTMIKKTSVLHPYYYLPFYKFIELYAGVIKSRDRGKGSIGAPQARAQELADATGITIMKYIAMMIFEQHFTLLQLLVTIERMRMNRKVTTKEISLFINGFDKHGLDEVLLTEHKPAWMENQAWIDCLVLEQLHHPFHGLRRSLIHNSTQWQEYFMHPITLMNPVPGSTLQELSVFQKCILWKMCCPHRTYELASAMTLFELGNLRLVADHYNVREVYKYADKTTPVVFIMPNSVNNADAPAGTRGFSYVSPTHEVKRLAKEVGMEGKVKVINFGVKGQMAEVTQVIEDCIQNGNWLLLQNYHLAEEPSQQFLEMLKDIVYRKWIEHDQRRQNTDVADEGASLVTFSKPGDHTDLQIHNTFRLWITTTADTGRLIPGVLVQHGLKVTCEKTSNFKTALQKSYRNVAFLFNGWKLANQSMSKSSRIMPLAMAHALLSHQSYYGNNAFVKDNHWTLADLAAAVEVFKKVLTRCQSADGVKKLVAQVYSDHCIDLTDSAYVWTIVNLLSEIAAKGHTKVEELKSYSAQQGVIGLLDLLLSSGDEDFNLRKAVESIEEVSARTYGLPEIVDTRLMASYSKTLSKDLIQVLGAPELLPKVTTPSSTLGSAVDLMISTILTSIQKLPILPDTNRNQVNPIDVFLHYETEGIKNLVHTIQSDLLLIQKRSKGEVLPGKHLEEVLRALTSGKVPSAWTSQSFPTYRGVLQWIRHFHVRVMKLSQYVKENPAVYNISNFLRPDRFFEAVKQAYARKHFKDVNNIDIEVQVMPAGLNPSVPPKDGIFISGLHLYNALWDSTRGVLLQSSAESKSNQEMPVLWLKPYDITMATPTRKHHTFKCPLFCCIDHRLHQYQNMVVEIPLPSLETPNLWYQQKTFMAIVADTMI